MSQYTSIDVMALDREQLTDLVDEILAIGALHGLSLVELLKPTT